MLSDLVAELVVSSCSEDDNLIAVDVKKSVTSDVDVNGNYVNPTIDARRLTGVDGGGLAEPLPVDDPTPVVIPPTAEPTKTPTPSASIGDVNCDGSMNLVDAILIQKLNNGDIKATAYCEVAQTNLFVYEVACDLNQDGSCTLLDSVILKQCNVDGSGTYCP